MQTEPDTPYRAFGAYRASKTWVPPELDAAALHGPAGGWSLAVQPFTEAAVPGVLAASLVAFRNAAGRSAYVQVGAIRHYPNEFAVIVGPTATARKNEALTVGRRPVTLADEDWDQRVCRGFGSGEAIVEEVRDAEDDDGATRDRRLLVHEDELAHPLAVAAREGSTLSPSDAGGPDLRDAPAAEVVRGTIHALFPSVAAVRPNRPRATQRALSLEHKPPWGGPPLQAFHAADCRGLYAAPGPPLLQRRAALSRALLRSVRVLAGPTQPGAEPPPLTRSRDALSSHGGGLVQRGVTRRPAEHQAFLAQRIRPAK